MTRQGGEKRLMGGRDAPGQEVQSGGCFPDRKCSGETGRERERGRGREREGERKQREREKGGKLKEQVHPVVQTAALP